MATIGKSLATFIIPWNRVSSIERNVLKTVWITLVQGKKLVHLSTLVKYVENKPLQRGMMILKILLVIVHDIVKTL